MATSKVVEVVGAGLLKLNFNRLQQTRIMMGIQNFAKELFSCGSNILSNGKYQLSYVTEGRGWVIDQVGGEIVAHLNRSSAIKARLTQSHLGLRNQIIHFGSVHAFLQKNGFQRPHKSNKVILTWFHFVPEDKKNKNILQAQSSLSFIHTSCSLTKNKLTALGVSPQKIVVIPLGIDLSLFKPALPQEKEKLRKELGIPNDKIIIGSFQKDGVGWGEGLEPKLIKGPDILVKVVEKLAKNFPIFVLLVGPSRGYVKKELQKRNIPFRSIGFLDDFREIARYYHVLDLYLVTSRIEGGPQAILESMASGVPLVSTKVGMVQDVVENGREALLAETENVEQIVSGAEAIIENQDRRNRLISNGLVKVRDYSWERIAEIYFREMYSKLLKL